jgi:adenosylhomocysteine nucleosidase
MKILLVENDPLKIANIEGVIAVELNCDGFEIIRTSTVNDALVRIAESRYDLVVVDLVLPQTNGGIEVDATQQWCELIENHLSGRTASWIVMTAHAGVVSGARDSFARHDVAVVHYDEGGAWKETLANKVRQHRRTKPLDFVVVCALTKERNGFAQAECTLGDLQVAYGLDCDVHP